MNTSRVPSEPRSRQRVSVAIAGNQPLIAESVRAALSSCGVEASMIPWSSDVARSEGMAAGSAAAARRPDVVLLLCDLETPLQVSQAQALVALWPVRTVLLTCAPAGPLWGALLAVGVDLVMSASTTLHELLTVLEDPDHVEPSIAPVTRRRLVRSWLNATAQGRADAARLALLTPRELSVLSLLHRGEPVRSIADRWDVSPATVRSHVRAVLQKLGVSSQLGAVAVFESSREQLGGSCVALVPSSGDQALPENPPQI